MPKGHMIVGAELKGGIPPLLSNEIHCPRCKTRLRRVYHAEPLSCITCGYESYASFTGKGKPRWTRNRLTG